MPRRGASQPSLGTKARRASREAATVAQGGRTMSQGRMSLYTALQQEQVPDALSQRSNVMAIRRRNSRLGLTKASDADLIEATMALLRRSDEQ